MQKAGVTAEFVYNADGLRVQKTVNGVVTKYTLHGKNIVHMTSGTDELHFFYDAQNRPAVVVYNGVPYAYVKSLQGDILAILDENGNAVVSYGYDAWGAPLWCTGELAETLGKVQPFRYRGYVFDEETGLYYIENRYYVPELLHFLNADNIIIVDTASAKFVGLYVYCNNSPVKNRDIDGHWSWDCLISGVINVVVGVAAVATAISALAAIPVATVGFTVAYVSVAVVTGVAGAASTITGVSNAVEGITDYNPIRDNLPDEDWQTGYDFVSGFSPVVATMGAYSIAPYIMRPPEEARSTASYVKHNHSSPPGHISRKHEGRELQQLGVDASSYTEYDIYAYDPSVNRGPERIVVDNNNRVYYTNDHYRTFWRMMFIN